MDVQLIVALILPLVLIQVVLIAIALWDLTRPERRVRGDNKTLWGIVIVFGELIGPALYFLVGRETE